MKVSFNKVFNTEKEVHYLSDVIRRKKISGDGYYTHLCHKFFEDRYHFKKVLLTTSCTDALEMAAILLDIQPGDEVIIPSYTFVSSANPFILRGAKVVFADSRYDHPNVDAFTIEPLITSKTKAIVLVHYAGIACDMDAIMKLAAHYNLFVVEDAAQAIDSFYKGQPLGGIGHLGCFSFHETKNITSGEGGLLVINDEQLIARAEIIWEKGTNRSAFFRKEVSKYEWMDIGSSFLPSELVAAFLYAQLENMDTIQNMRREIWDQYFFHLNKIETGSIRIPALPNYAFNNAHAFYLVCSTVNQKNELINYLKDKGVQASSHYLPLHLSAYFRQKHDGRELTNAIKFSDGLVRLPLYCDLSVDEQQYIIAALKLFFEKRENNKKVVFQSAFPKTLV